MARTNQLYISILPQSHFFCFSSAILRLCSQPSSLKMSLLPDPRRIVTGHNEAGKAIVVADGTVPCEPTAVKCNFAVLYETHQFPASLGEWNDPITDRTKNLSNDKGVVLRVVDFPPKTETVSCFLLLNGKIEGGRPGQKAFAD